MGDGTLPKRERAYDEHIAPLITRVAELCEEHGVPFLATFQIDDGEDPRDPFFCTSYAPHKPCSHVLREARDVIYPQPVTLAMTIASGPKGGE